ncbi:hypothetical protein Salat_2440800 [Sesamum alatum]|uniref:Uncharacterized protein n=1 Tax=Sesamum alatum TaxID=300844 RepID=A0AAE1XYJ9_9LAMI|nr:hypothetical protein Salat_2440800 [Sesamum alatum]
MNVTTNHSLFPPSAATGNPSDGGTFDTAAGTTDDEDTRTNFNYSKFSNLADRVLGAGDSDALKTLERFRHGGVKSMATVRQVRPRQRWVRSWKFQLPPCERKGVV